ncbi:hypothetical protein [Arsenophonus nasoniae]|uniref:hypothetical protein n=1 Tax=Arsenophonus nasoniae TaxID=638 RepID=UPI0038790D77
MDDFYNKLKKDILSFISQDGVDLTKKGAITGLVRYIYDSLTEAMLYSPLSVLIDTINHDKDINVTLNYKSVFGAVKRLSENRKTTLKTNTNDINQSQIKKEKITEKTKKMTIDEELNALGINKNTFMSYRSICYNENLALRAIKHNISLEELEKQNFSNFAQASAWISAKINNF